MYQLTEPEIIVEIVVTDVQAEDGNGAPIRQWALALEKDAGWSTVAAVDGASLLHPSVVRVRDDKEVNAVDVRVGQLNERCLTRGLDEEAKKPELQKSEVIRREVYTKTSKGQLVVRKLLVWQTNKDQIDPSWPAFVVHFTDYSPARSSPLKREVRTAPDAATAEGIANGIVAAQIKTGWSRV